MPSLPDWLSFLQYIVWPLFVLLVLVIVFFTFTAWSPISSPRRSTASSRKRSRWWFAAAATSAVQLGELLAMIPRTMGRGSRKLAYFLPRALVLLVLSFVPGST